MPNHNIFSLGGSAFGSVRCDAFVTCTMINEVSGWVALVWVILRNPKSVLNECGAATRVGERLDEGCDDVWCFQFVCGWLSDPILL